MASASDSPPAPSVDRSEPVVSGSSYLSAGGDGGATVDFLDLFFPPFLPPPALPPILLADFFVDFADFFVPFLPPPFFVDFLPPFFVDFFPPRFLVPLPPPPLRAPLDFLVPFLATILLAPSVGLSLAHRNKII